MESAMKISSSIIFPINSTPKSNNYNKISYGFRYNGSNSIFKICAVYSNGSVSSSASYGAESRAVGDAHRRRSSLESLFCYDKPIPEERIEEPVGVSLAEKIVGDNLRCTDCQAKGAVLCTTCSGSGLYVDSILESQGIIVKVRCLGHFVLGGSRALLLCHVVEEVAILCAQNAVAEVI
ncbi:DnaJ/Hsp40 cysteine-rich domain superfamily protein isoform 2 [Theobroma cacao]|uniref:DnaJ/Hsp40 cysteine-rich domain superfamily protein isoform 2 n=1 Tax=Theobroma cacao TaxID=3641 RepID=A0A061F072_THECC|nr:DnaJ/Hsp40 cysteine-rich domain superfamily protein isoform 2 [Theobroma cacao]